MTYLTDRSYLATCRRFGIVPSAADYVEYLAEAGAVADDDEWAFEFDGEAF